MAVGKKTTGTVDAVVLASSYSWHETSNDPTTPRHDAEQGDKITVSGAEWDRSQAMVPQGLAKPKSDEAKAAVADADDSTA